MFNQAIEQFDLVGPERLVGRFEHDGDVVETDVVHQQAEKLHAHHAFSHAVVAIHVSGQLLLRVVEVDTSQVGEADHLVEVAKRLGKSLRCTDLVACRQGVGRIDANAYTALILYPLDDRGDLLEGVAQVGTLPRRILDHGSHTLGLRQGPVDGVGNQGQAGLRLDLLQVAARMEVQKLQPQLLAATHLVEEGLSRLLKTFGFGVS